MAVKYNFRQTCDEDLGCYYPPPDFSCTPECEPCRPKCEPKCPPRVRAKDAICLSNDECERCFSLFQYVGCEIAKIPVFIKRIGMKVRKQGYCTVLTEECPVRADAQGNACFTWSDCFRELEAGYYEADMYVNDECCFTLLFYKRKCWGKMRTESVELVSPDLCGADGCVGCIPQPDVETADPVADCEECDKC